MKHGDPFDDLIHDIRNRLTIARANVEAFIDGKLPPTIGRLKAVLQSLNQLELLLKDVRLSHAGVDATIEPVLIDVCEILNREYKAVEAVASAKNISFSVSRCPAKLEACTRFVGDPLRISQIVSNVVLNAIRYTPAGGSIAVDCSHNAGQLEVSISDSGPGIDPADADRIFEPGFRGRAANGTSGSGYGLAIAKEFVEAHGGTIVAGPSEQHGARFVVRLPGATEPQGSPAQCAHCEAKRSSEH